MIIEPIPGRLLVGIGKNIFLWLRESHEMHLSVSLVPTTVPSRLLRVYEVQNPEGIQLGWGFEPLTPEFSVVGTALILKAKNAPPIGNDVAFHHDYIVEDWHLFDWDSKYAMLVVTPDAAVLNKLEP